MAKDEKPGPLTGWRRGEVVRTTAPILNVVRDMETLPVGERLVLQAFQRVQDGIEMWTAWRGDELWGVHHDALERLDVPAKKSPTFGYRW